MTLPFWDTRAGQSANGGSSARVSIGSLSGRDDVYPLSCLLSGDGPEVDLDNCSLVRPRIKGARVFLAARDAEND